MLLITILFLTILLLLSYVLFDKDLLAPPTVVSIVLLFGALSTFYNENRWAIEFSSTTLGVIATAVVSFFIGSMIALILVNIHRLDRVGFNHIVEKVQPVDIAAGKTALLVFIQLLTIAWLFFELRRLTGGAMWLEMVAIFRNQTASVDPDQYTMRLSGLLRQFISLGFAIAFVYSYVVGTNLALRHRQPLINWVPILLSTFTSFMQGYRSDMIRLWIAVLIVSYFTKKRSVGWQSNKETKKMIKRMALSVFAIAALFVAARGLVGRTTTKGPIYYLTFYAGCPMAALDEFLKNPLTESDIWGKETFYNLNQSIAILLKKPELRYIFFKEFRRSPNGTPIGNVYTAIRPPYYDFGFYGMIIVMVLMGLFFTYLYIKTRKRYGNNPIDMRLLLYSYIAYTFFMFFYNCYNTFISLSFIKFIILVLLIRWYLITWRFMGGTQTQLINGQRV